jgi:5,10-methylenetetrahydromethanopterin reductase
MKDFDIAAYTSFSVDPDRDRAIKEAKIVVAFIVAGSLQLVLDRHDIPHEEAQNLDQLLFNGKFKEAAAAVTPEMLDAFAIYGTPADCIQKIEDLSQAGVTQIVCGSPLGKDIPRAIRLIGKTIMPEFLGRW